MIATNAFKQAVVGTYTASDTVIELNSISDTVGASDYLPDGGFNLILYDGLFGNPADANNAGKYEIFECTGVNYATNEITVVREVENTTAVTIDASSWQVVYGATKELLESLTSDWGDIGGTLSDQTDLQNALDAKIPTADIINDLVTGGATKVLSAEQGVELNTNKVAKAGDTMTGLLRNASGINFNASGGDTLSDFENEGTFTPIIEGNTTAGTGTYTTQVGRYSLIGGRCFFNLQVQWTGHTGTGGVRIAGLPFTVRNIANGNGIASGVFVGTSYTGVGFFQLTANSDRITVGTQNGGTSATPVVESHTSALIILSGHYQIEP